VIQHLPEPLGEQETWTSMAKIPVGHVKAGMVVRSAVTDRHGRRLIGEGTELTDRHVGALGMWGVPFVDVEGVEPENELETIPPQALEAAREEVDEIFALTDTSHPLIEGLFDIALTRRAKKHAMLMGNGVRHD
jgi:hypothetical protein